MKEYPPNNWKAIFISFFIAVFLHLSGTDVLVVYSQELAEGFMPGSAAEFPLYINGIQFLASLAAMFLLEKFKRRFFMIQMVIALMFSLFGLYVGLKIKTLHPEIANVIIVSCLLLSIMFISLSVNTITWLYIPEVVQPNIVPITTGVLWMMGALSTLLFPMIRKSCG